MDNAEIKRTDNIAKAAIGLNEIYRVFEEPELIPKQLPETRHEKTQEPSNIAQNTLLIGKKPLRIPLSKLVDDAKRQEIFNNEIQNQIGKLSGSNIFFVEYRGRKYPKEIERNFMLHTAHTFSDIPCLPITPLIASAIIAGKLPFDDYLSFIKGSMEWLKSYRKKPIMGIVVNFGYTKLEKLIKLYVDQGINAFCIDFDCHTPISHKSAIAQCYRILDEDGKSDRTKNSLFYAINVNQGRFIHNRTVVNAKDILSFGFGLDAMGKRHRAKFPSKETRERLGIKWTPLDRKDNKARLFIKTDYGYYKVQNAKDIKNYPHDSLIPLSTFTNSSQIHSSQVQHCEKIFNMEQLGLEAFTLRKIIEQEVPTKYLERKAHVDPNDVKQIKDFRESVVHPQKSLDEVFL
jgi:hypothetical protein